MYKSLILLIVIAVASPAVNGAIYIKFPDIPGESKFGVPVNSWEWSAQNDSKSGCHQPLRVIKKLDKSTPIVLQQFVDSVMHPQVEIIVVDDRTGLERQRIRMADVQIGEYRTQYSAREDLPTEEVAFYFSKLSFKYSSSFDGRVGEVSEVSLPIQKQCKG